MTGTFLDQLGHWLDEDWNAELTVHEWWERLGPSGWAAPHWPADRFGRGLAPAEAVQVRSVLCARDVLGPPGGLLHASDGSPASPGDDPLAAAVTATARLSPAPSIHGGTDEIQRNLLAERVLGLPREGLDDTGRPFRDVPRNA